MDFFIYMGRRILIPIMKGLNMYEDNSKKGKFHMLKFKLFMCISDCGWGGVKNLPQFLCSKRRVGRSEVISYIESQDL